MSLAAGSRLGPYEVLAPIGAGGMGEVYRAKDTRLDRVVAIKVLPAHVSQDPERKARFEREAKTVASLNHPHICVLHDVGHQDTAQGPVDFLVMEYLEGETLAERVAKGPLPIDQVLRYGTEIADALDAAHAKAIIHRDIKPANLFITGHGLAKVLDFGLAKLAVPPSAGLSDSPTLSREQGLTSPGTGPGTIAYMSPEQVRGEKLDARSDLFSLGVVLYEMTTGRHPFAGLTVGVTLEAILNRGPRDPIAARIPEALAAIIGKLLEKDRELRYQHAAEVRADLRRLQRDSSGSAPGPGPRRPRRVLAAAMATLLVLGVGFGFYRIWRGSGWQKIDSIAVLPFENVGGGAEGEYLGEGISDSLTSKLTNLPRLAVRARSSVFRYRGTLEDPKRVATELGVAAIVTGRVEQHSDRLVVRAELVEGATGNQLWSQRYSVAPGGLLDLEEDISRTLAEALRLRLTDEERARASRRPTTKPEAHQLYLKARYHARKFSLQDMPLAESEVRRAIEIDPDFALAHAWLAWILYSAGDFTKPAAEVFPEAGRVARRAADLDDSLSEGHAMLVYTHLFAHEWESAEREMRRALDLDPENAEALLFSSFYLSCLGRFEESDTLARRAVDVDPLYPMAHTFSGWAMLFAGRPSEAAAAFKDALALERDDFLSGTLLGVALDEQGARAEALAALRRADAVSDHHPWTRAALGNALGHGAAEERAEARKIAGELVARSGSEVVTAYDVALVHAGLGEKDEALDWLEKAYAADSFWMCHLKVDPRLAGLRAEPRFQALIREIGFPQ